MSASTRSLLLYDLLAPEFLGGFTFPSYIDSYLSLLAVSGLTMTSDDTAGQYTGGVLYTGTVYFPSAPGSQPPVTQHTDPSGAVFQWSDVNFQFRLRTWREGSSDIQSVVNAVSGITSGSNTIQGLFNNFNPSGSPVAGSPDYPGLRFRLELLVSVLTFHMGSDWVPGVMDATYHVVQDTTSASTDVRILLPKITLCYEQVENFSAAPTFHLDSWGSGGFDAPSDLDSGQLVTMQPPLALNLNKRVAFSVQNILLDLSPNNTPYEILSMFGVGSDFTGVYIKALQFYYSDEDKDFAFNISVQDALISFQGQVWLEAELDLMFDPASHPQSGGLEVTPTFLADNQPLQSNASTQQTADPVDNNNVIYLGGSITAPPNVYIQLQATGGTAPYTYAVDYTSSQGNSNPVHLWDSNQNQAYFTPPTPAPPIANDSGTLVITVTDSTAGTPMKYTNTYTMNIAPAAGAMPDGAPEDSATNPANALATFVADARPTNIPAGYEINFTPSQSSTIETLVITGCPNPKLTVTITPAGGSAGSPQQVNVSASGQAIIEVDPGASIAVSVDYPQQPQPSNTYNLYFNYDGPSSDASVTSYTAGTPSPDDPIFDGNVIPADIQGDGEAHTGGDALTYWVKTALDITQDITIKGQASYEGYEGTAPHNLTLSQRRANVAKAFVDAANPTGTVNATGDGQTAAQSSGSVSNPQDRVATVMGTAVAGQQEWTLTGTLARAASTTPAATPPATQATTPPNTPPAGSNSSKPPSLKRLSFRVRLEKNIPVMLEISGEIDFQQQTQKALQQAPGSDPNGNLNLQNNNPGATSNPNAGPSVLDFLLNVTYDTATCNLTETLTLGSGPAPSNGLLQMTNGPAGSYDTFKNIMGAVMIFTPIINAATTALDPGSAGEWTDIALSLGLPVTIGGLGWINTTKITLYGGTLIARENVPSGPSSTKFTAASLTFDYGVSFRIDVDPLNIHSSRDLSVRYKAFGFSLDFSGTPPFQFVFDTSKGYELDLSDPSLFNLPSPLADLLKIAGARIAQFNPLTIEIDLVIKQDLGVITVDEFLIKVPLEQNSVPMILPSGIHVNLPGVLTGGGQVNIQQGSFEGSFDLTLVALSLRVAASVGVSSVTSPDGRSATAFYLGMEVDFPTPIILGDTGLGIFGFFGLFAMHYMRNLPMVPAGDIYGPDLQWLIDANGQPQSLQPLPASNDPQQNPENQNWIPSLGSWGFGVGLLLGTVDGFLLTMRGMFILTLPGPQIIITINLKFISEIDSADGGIATDSLTVGILGILDLDFNLGQITIGVSINLAVQDLISIVVPISIFFSWTDPSTWHFWLGTIQTPISANILGIVKGSGYFMFGGQAIQPFPPGSTGSLPGVAVAVGFSASIIWGSESVDIYLAVVVTADLGVSFSPSLFISGEISLSGKLQLLIISIGASGNFQITAPTPFYLNVQVCGSVSFFFFSVQACCGFSIGSNPPPPPPPPLVSRMYLQSYAPVIASGQGGTRPIDASLGNGLETVTTPSALSTLPNGAVANQPPKPGSDPNNLVVVPIDTVPVLQFEYAADASSITSTFTATLPQCPMFPTSVGGMSVGLGGGRTAVYSLTSLSISAVDASSLNPVTPPLPPGTGAVPVVWRKNTPANNQTATRVDLAMFSRDPNIASHALERSTTLNGQLTSIWSGVCDPIAPPACVLWTFCKQPVAYPQTTWNLTGIPVPDPPGTTRSSPVPTAMEVTAPSYHNAAALIAALSPLFGGNAFRPARVIGLGNEDESEREGCFRGLELPEIIETSLSLYTGPRSVDEPGGAPIVQNAAATARLQALEDRWRWVRLDVGASTQVSMYMAVDPVLAAVSFSAFGDTSGLGVFDSAFDLDVDLDLVKAANQLKPVLPVVQQTSGAQADYVASEIVIRERDVSGAMLRESTLASLNPNLVLGTIGLPAVWTDPAGPWWSEIAKIALYFNAALQNLSKIFVQFTPLARTTVVEVAVVGPVLPERPTVVIGAVQACSQAEQTRAQVGLEVQTGQVATLEGYLSGGATVPLLIPNTAYTITLGYNVTTTEKDGTQTSYTGIEQGFTFQTDNVPPAALSPWVLACLPANQEEDVFYEDPLTIAFNDNEAIQLFAAYGEQLVLQLHAADGLDDPAQTVSANAQVSGIGPAGYDSLLNLINQGLAPCVGSATSYLNAQYTAPVALRPKMAYTLDIVMDPAPAVPQGQQPVPVVPLYRTRFTTSKYASLGELAAEVGTSRILHGNLSGPLTTLAALISGKSTQVTDQAMESAFVTAGEQALPAPAGNTITIYWIPGPGNGPYVPHCMLIDGTEPLWRWRQEPSLVPVDPKDPSFNIVQMTAVPALEVVESSGTSIAGFLYSPSGTRTVAFFSASFSPPAGGATVTLDLHRPASTAFSLPDVAATIVALPIGPQAPWEADHV